MTGTGGTMMPGDALASVLRLVGSRSDDDRVTLSPADADAADALHALYADWALAAWRETQLYGQVRAQATGVDQTRLAVCDYTEAVSVATRWSDSLAVLCGVEVPDSGDEAIDAAHRAVTAGLLLLIARDGTSAAAVIHNECRLLANDLRVGRVVR